jgi:hypothetical protein
LQGTHDVDRRGEWTSHTSSPSAFYCLYEPKAQLSLLGRRTDDYYPPLCPLLLLLIGLFLGCNVYERVLGFLGFDTCEVPEADESTHTGKEGIFAAAGGALAKLGDKLRTRSKAAEDGRQPLLQNECHSAASESSAGPSSRS